MEQRFELYFFHYYTFFTGLLKLEHQLSSLHAYRTDGEEALVKALEVYITGLLTIAADQVDLPLVPQVTIKAI